MGLGHYDGLGEYCGLILPPLCFLYYHCRKRIVVECHDYSMVRAQKSPAGGLMSPWGVCFTEHSPGGAMSCLRGWGGVEGEGELKEGSRIHVLLKL